MCHCCRPNSVGSVADKMNTQMGSATLDGKRDSNVLREPEINKSTERKILTVLVLVALTITTASAQYQRTDLVSNQPGVAPNTDPHLVNAWGLVSLPTSPWWVSDNGTGFSTLNTGTGQQIQLFVTVPPAPGQPAGTLGTPTGVVGNISTNPNDFTITENGVSGRSIFIFATLDGTISGWNPVDWRRRRATVMPLSRLIDQT